MSIKEIESRRKLFKGLLMYTGKEFETIERIIRDKKYNNIQLSKIVQRMFLQHARFNRTFMELKYTRSKLCGVLQMF